VTTLRPLWRYMGGKRDLAPIVVEALGTGWSRYVEPCLGAGSVALALPPGPMLLADVDAPLVRLWQAVQTRPEALALDVARYVDGGLTAGHYRALVELEVRGNPAALLVLLQSCFNGVYRRGRFGLFNCPWNRKPVPSVPTTPDLVAVAQHLAGAVVVQADAHDVLETCGPVTPSTWTRPTSERSPTAAATAGGGASSAGSSRSASAPGDVGRAWSSATTTPPSCGRCWGTGGSCGPWLARARSTATGPGGVASPRWFLRLRVDVFTRWR